mmetsp:Transcript_7770/g.29081  ORF Transcript_7770/g.29081 Transcript_7770/m.29081 type:complete len:212 (-) Transcript_7770:118-753(-)
MRCVRPILTIVSHSLDLRSKSSRRTRKPGISPSRTSYAVATDMAVGKTSLELWLMFTWSFGCTGVLLPKTEPTISHARFEITSLTFMLVCVPLPVCHTTSGKCASSFPSMISRDAARISPAISEGNFPRSSLTLAAACFTIASARNISTGIFSPPILKFSRLLCVCAPQYLSLGTRTVPMESVSSRQKSSVVVVSGAREKRCEPLGRTLLS